MVFRILFVLYFVLSLKLLYLGCLLVQLSNSFFPYLTPAPFALVLVLAV
jgi:hypothetical protein